MLQRGPESVLFLGDFVPNVSYRVGPSLLSELTNHDLRVVNLEGAFTEIAAGRIFKAGPHMLLRERHLQQWTGLIDVAVLANNHAMDFGVQGLEYTKEVLRAHNIATVGAGRTRLEAHSPIDIGSLRIIAIAEHEFGGATANSPGIATVEDEYLLLTNIHEGRRQGKCVVVFSHGGSEVVPVPAPYLRKRYRNWVDSGAHLVVGCHPHVTQGFERWNEGEIYYSVGNFAFPFEAFKNHSEACRSIGLSFNLRDRSTRVIHFTNRQDEIEILEDPGVTNKFATACQILYSSDYEVIHKEIAKKLFPLWYQRLGIHDKNDAALLLHYFRCDAHRHLIQDALEDMIGETIEKTTQIFHLDADPDTPECMRIWRSDEVTDSREHTSSRDLESLGERMQMTKRERERIRDILLQCHSFLEIGAGFSTLYFSQYIPELVSVETRTRWFLDVQEMLHTHGVTNVQLNLFPPETCAYDASGKETWTHRKRPKEATMG
jgi:hypothetical protein